MKTVLSLIATCALLLPASAAVAAAPARHFKNCTAMHKTYKGGVARKGAHDHRSGGGHARYAPRVSTALYRANSTMDRDHDGIACEQ
jgi:uncharacterized membrane protein